MPRIPKPPLIPSFVLVALVVGALFAFGVPGDARQPLGAAPEAVTPTSNGAAKVVAPVPGPSSLAPSRWVSDENAKPGTTEWRLNKPSAGDIEGFASTVSAQRGDTVSLFISTKAKSYVVVAYRMGYYAGTGGRLLWTSPPQTGTVQSRPTIVRRTNMVEAAWQPSLSVTIDPSWPPGDYLFKLVGDNAVQGYIPLTVRDDASTSALVIQNSVTTWQAYNLWGNYDLYEGQTSGGGSSYSNRSRAVSFDRPYKIGDGSGDFLGNEFPLVSLVESLGLDVSYSTDVDLDLHPDLLLRHRGLISLGHDEYWSANMRQAAENARDHGVNLAFLGANAVFRKIRLEDSPLGAGRHEVDYKTDSRNDPMYGTDNSAVTSDWREPPINKPENTLLGELYQCNPVKADFVVSEPSAWIYDGTNLHAGDHLTDLVGSEYDRFVPGVAGPENVEIMGHSPLRCRGNSDYSDFTYYTAASGAGVIDTGTNQWVPKLTDPAAMPPLVRITENILAAFAAGPAGLAHPSTANFASLSAGTYVPSPSGATYVPTPPAVIRRRFRPSPTPRTPPVTSDSPPGTVTKPPVPKSTPGTVPRPIH